MNFKLEQTDTNAVMVSMDGIKAGWEQEFLLRSDAHSDNPKSNNAMELRHLKRAKKIGAGVICAGDQFDAMQGKHDKRSAKSALKIDLKKDDYLNELVTWKAEMYEPYVKNFVGFGYGNHETSVISKVEFDLIKGLARELELMTKVKIPVLGYTGFVIFKFKIGTNSRMRKILWFTHGHGAGAPMTKGMIDAGRQRMLIDNVDIMMSGHDHNSWIDDFPKMYVDEKGIIRRKDMKYIKIPSYKDAWGTGKNGWDVEKTTPKPIGAYWLKFVYRDGQIKIEVNKAD